MDYVFSVLAGSSISSGLISCITKCSRDQLLLMCQVLSEIHICGIEWNG